VGGGRCGESDEGERDDDPGHDGLLLTTLRNDTPDTPLRLDGVHRVA
jgi:hypothetical protein